MYEPSCSSSTTTRPRRCTGAKIALRAPSTTSARPSRTRRCSAARWAGVRAECQIAMSSPRRARRRPSSCGVSAISGTSTMLPRPRARAASIACRYTSVFPEPVTPCTSRGPPSPSIRRSSSATTAAWGPVSDGGASGRGAAPPAAVRASPGPVRSRTSAIAPASAIARRVGMVVLAVGAQPRRGQAPARPLEDRGHLAPARREPLERGAGALGDQALRAASRRGGEHPAAVVGAPQRPAAPRRQHQPQAGRDRGQVVPGHPPRQLEELGRHRGDVDDAGQGHQAPRVGRSRAVHDHAEHPPRPEGAHDQGARLRGPVEPPGDRVVQDAVEPARRHQGEDLGGGAHLTAVRPWRRAFRRPRGRRRCSPT